MNEAFFITFCIMFLTLLYGLLNYILVKENLSDGSAYWHIQKKILGEN